MLLLTPQGSGAHDTHREDLNSVPCPLPLDGYTNREPPRRHRSRASPTSPSVPPLYLLSTSREAQTSPAADVSQCEMATAGVSASQEQGSRPYMRPPCFTGGAAATICSCWGWWPGERIQVADHLLIDWGNGVEHTCDRQYRVAFVMEPSSKASHDHAAASARKLKLRRIQAKVPRAAPQASYGSFEAAQKPWPAGRSSSSERLSVATF
jgi:hypothetical protein